MAGPAQVGTDPSEVTWEKPRYDWVCTGCDERLITGDPELLQQSRP